MLSKATWSYSDDHEEEIQEHDETVKDEWTNVKITDYSANDSDFARDYSLYINETYTVTDRVHVMDSTRLS